MSRNIILSLLALILFSCITLLGFSKHLNTSTTPDPTPDSINSKNTSNGKPVSFGILMPLEHAALKEIVDGFETTVKRHYPEAVFDVQNAQGDIKLQRSIIERFAGQNVDIIVPIGTTATQMTLAFIKNQPIVSLAADYSESDRQKRTPINITGVLDEIGGKKKLEFIKQVLPELTKLTIIYHSGNEKNFKEIQELIDYGKTMNVHIQKLSIITLPDLESTAQAIDQDSQAILILKDHLVVSGIHLLIPTAQERYIPLITSDEGSVEEGSTFALGVKERSIGEEGGKLAIKLLEGTPIQTLPMTAIPALDVFYRPGELLKLNIKIQTLQEAAHKFGYKTDAKY